MRALRGWMKLAFRQAEGRYAEITALCLKYLTGAATCAAMTVLWIRNGGTPYNGVTAVCAAGAAVLTVYFRTAARYRLYAISDGYLCSPDDVAAPQPTVMQLLGFGLGYCAAVCSVWTLLLSPAVLCFYAGVDFYAMSGNRQSFMLLLCAAFCLSAGGMLAATVTVSRMGCAEYLYFSGKCGTVAEALDLSRQITRENRGDLLALSLLAAPCGMGIAALSRFNFSQTLLTEQRKT